MANPYVKSWDIPSSSSSKIYKVSQRADGNFSCDCPGHKFKPAPKPDCKHIREVKAMQASALKITSHRIALCSNCHTLTSLAGDKTLCRRCENSHNLQKRRRPSQIWPETTSRFCIHLELRENCQICTGIKPNPRPFRAKPQTSTPEPTTAKKRRPICLTSDAFESNE